MPRCTTPLDPAAGPARRPGGGPGRAALPDLPARPDHRGTADPPADRLRLRRLRVPGDPRQPAARGPRRPERTAPAEGELRLLRRAGRPPGGQPPPAGRSRRAITVAGFSKGGWIAILASSRLQNPDLSFVFMGACGPWAFGPDLHVSGRMLLALRDQRLPGRLLRADVRAPEPGLVRRGDRARPGPRPRHLLPAPVRLARLPSHRLGEWTAAGARASPSPPPPSARPARSTSTRRRGTTRRPRRASRCSTCRTAGSTRTSRTWWPRWTR